MPNMSDYANFMDFVHGAGLEYSQAEQWLGFNEQTDMVAKRTSVILKCTGVEFAFSSNLSLEKIYMPEKSTIADRIMLKLGILPKKYKEAYNDTINI